MSCVCAGERVVGELKKKKLKKTLLIRKSDGQAATSHDNVMFIRHELKNIYIYI